MIIRNHYAMTFPQGVPLPLIVVVPWPNGDIRMYVGLTKWHQAVKRELYQISTVTVESTLGSIGQGAVYLKLDANSGISSRQPLLHLWKVSATTRYLLSSWVLPEANDAGIETLTWCQIRYLVDYILVIVRNQIEHDERLTAVSDRLQEEGFTLWKVCILCFQVPWTDYWLPRSPKWSFQSSGRCRLPEATWCSWISMVPWRGKPAYEVLPEFGCAYQTSERFAQDQYCMVWSPNEVDALTCLKKELASELVLAIYHPEYETIVSTDASSYVLVAALLQLQAMGELKPVAYASRSMTDTECRYAQIEKQTLLINLVSRTSGYQR